MAIYHLHAKIISRSSGRSSVAAAAYRAGVEITNERDGLTHDYTKRHDVVHTEVMLPVNAPQEYADRAILWNAVEKAEKQKNAQLAREYEIALPIELNREEQIKLVQDYVKSNFVDKGMCADICIHDGHKKCFNEWRDMNTPDNPHAHVLLTMRPIERDGTWGAKSKKIYLLDKDGNKIYNKVTKQYKCTRANTTNWDEKEFLISARRDWAMRINKELSFKGITRLVDYRTLKAQGVEREPQIHLGAAHKMEARAVNTDRGIIHNQNIEIKKIDEQIETLQKEKAKIISMPNRQQQEISTLDDIRKLGNSERTQETIETPKITTQEIASRIAQSMPREQPILITQKEKDTLRENIRGAETLYNKINRCDERIEQLKQDRQGLPLLFSGSEKKAIDNEISKLTTERNIATETLQRNYSLTPEKAPHQIQQMRNTLTRSRVVEPKKTMSELDRKIDKLRREKEATKAKEPTRSRDHDHGLKPKPKDRGRER